MTAAVFWLIDWQYKWVTKKINPLSALVFLEQQCFWSLARAHQFAADVASWLRIGDESLTTDEALAVSYMKFASPHLAHVDRQLENIAEISLRLAAKGELLATKRGLAATHNVLAKYLQFRSSSFLALPAGPYLMVVESDNQSFLARNFERLNTAGERLMAQRESQSVVFITDLYASLVQYAKEIRFLNRPGENPIVDHIRGYSSSLVDSAIRANDLEVCFRSINVCKTIGAAAVEQKLRATTLSGVYGDLTKIAMWAISNKSPAFVEYCTEPIVSSLATAVEEDAQDLDFQMSEALGALQLITLATHSALLAGVIPTTISSPFMAGKCYEQLQVAMALLIERYDAKIEGREKRTFASNLSRLFKELYRSLRDLSEKLRKCDEPVVLNIGSLIEEALKELAHLANNATDAGRRQSFEEELSGYVHLPGCFVEHAPTFSTTHAFGMLADIAPKTGLLLLHREQWPAYAIDCADAAFVITKQMLAKATDTHAYAEPRQMLSICFLAVVALKKGSAGVELASRVVRMIREFEQLYRERYFATFTPPATAYLGPRPSQLLIELGRWRDDVVRGGGKWLALSDHSRDIVRQMVNVADIDRFMLEAWEVVPNDCPIEPELRERLNRKQAIRQLLALLKAELRQQATTAADSRV